MLLNHNCNVTNVTPLTTQEHQTWGQIMNTLKELEDLRDQGHCLPAPAASGGPPHLQGIVVYRERHCGAPPTQWLWRGQWDMEVEIEFPKPIQSCMKVAQGEKTLLHLCEYQPPSQAFPRGLPCTCWVPETLLWATPPVTEIGSPTVPSRCDLLIGS